MNTRDVNQSFAADYGLFFDALSASVNQAPPGMCVDTGPSDWLSVHHAGPHEDFTSPHVPEPPREATGGNVNQLICQISVAKEAVKNAAAGAALGTAVGAGACAVVAPYAVPVCAVGGLATGASLGIVGGMADGLNAASCQQLISTSIAGTGVLSDGTQVTSDGRGTLIFDPGRQ